MNWRTQANQSTNCVIDSPLLADFIACNWDDSRILGLSALGRPLDKDQPDEDYVAIGSERFGYVVLEDGTRSPDLTLPIQSLITDSS